MRLIIGALLGALLFTSSATATPIATVAQKDGTLDLRKLKPSKTLVAKLKREAGRKRVAVTVILSERWKPETRLTSDQVRAQRLDIARAGTRALKGLAKHVKLRRATLGLPFVSVEADAQALAALAKDPHVAWLEEIRTYEMSDADSVSYHGASAVHPIGATGSGWTVAVIDSGVQADHPYLNGRVLPGACFSQQKLCPNGQTSMVGGAAARPCTHSANCWHGTHVAGIVAGSDRSYGIGIAPGASILPVNASSGPGSDGRAYVHTDDWHAGLKWVAGQAASRKIAAVNLSLGGGESSLRCASWDVAGQVAIKAVRDAGVAVVAAAGNDGYRDGIAAPACLPDVVAVGALSDPATAPFSDSGTPVEMAASFTNAARILDLWASGVNIASASPDGSFLVKQGTSMAAPHVAGAFALLKQLAPNATHDTLREVLKATGTPVKDTRTGGLWTAPRMDLARAAHELHRRGLATGVKLQPRAVPDHESDFNGDNRKDIAVFRPSNGTWYWIESATNKPGELKFGQAGDVPVPGDYDGDGVTDLAIFRRGTWFRRNSADGMQTVGLSFGVSGDVPVPGDYDGDKKSDYAVFRPANGTWYWIRSSDGNYGQAVPFGEPTDLPAPADYSGDGITDVSVFRPREGKWYWRDTATGATPPPLAGLHMADQPSPALYEGADLLADMGFYRRSKPGFAVGLGGFVDMTGASAIPMGADYDGDGVADRSVASFSKQHGVIVWNTPAGTPAFGLSTDEPLR